MWHVIIEKSEIQTTFIPLVKHIYGRYKLKYNIKTILKIFKRRTYTFSF